MFCNFLCISLLLLYFFSEYVTVPCSLICGVKTKLRLESVGLGLVLGLGLG